MAVFTGLLVVGWLGVRERVIPEFDDARARKERGAAQALARSLVEPVAAGDADAAAAVLATVGDDPALVGAVVVDADGRELVRIGGASGELATRESIAVGGTRLGAVAVAFDDLRARELNAFMAWVGLASLFIVVAVIGAGFLFARSLTAPIHRMMDFARDVAGGQRDGRLPDSRGDELGELARHLNFMTRRIHDREVRLRRARTELMRSTRLASVGEMAGRTAHEVLNPVTSVRGRLDKIEALTRDGGLTEPLRLLDDIVTGWATAFRDGGVRGLARELSAPVTSEHGTLLEEDLANLAAISGMIKSFHTRRVDDVQFMRRELDRVVRIVDGMRSLSRSFGSATVQPVREMLDEAAEIVSDSSDKRNIRLDVSGDPGACVLVDRYEMLQVLANLLRNGMLAVEEHRGRGGGRIALDLEVVGGRALIRVTDNGCGISDAHLPLIFESSFTTRGASDGTGLGLSIARRLIRGAGGELTVEHTAAGSGTTFLIEMPLSYPGEKHERNLAPAHTAAIVTA